METLQKIQLVALVEHIDTENFKELRNKEISLENSSDMRNYILN